MRKNTAKKWAGSIGAVGVLSMSLLASGPATAAEGMPADATKAPGVNRVIDRTSETVPMDSGAVRALRSEQGLTVQTSRESDTTVRSVTVDSMTPLTDVGRLEPGQSVQVN
ncbi:hypothetical protein Q7F20_03605 [Curtobacterium sp. A7_M15]|uniref:hypothetical protein n=1 Tax=Curtobacterium sp. A7_M15 TaxID=3065241 RepID=UPI002737DDEB|nr:hypothetical protein [Curtobacterium sp. A7_M15]MDP4332442.1 hypothetical protein [Curtobacterium sp. A7_M15]